jgi:uncharacterized protein YndB with AHSA1/START domain
MSGDAEILGSLQSVDGQGVVRITARLDTGVDDVWAALNDPERLAGWFGRVEGDLSAGGEFRVHITLSGERTGRVDVCEPAHHLRWTMHDPDTRPGQPERTVIDAHLTAEGAHTRLIWEEQGIPVKLLPAYGAGIQIHVEHLADHLSGRPLRDMEARWGELFPAYQSAGVS